MSAEEMTANGGVITAGAAEQIDSAIQYLLQAQRLVSDLQAEQTVGGFIWHKLETIDDRIHDALSKLGN